MVESTLLATGLEMLSGLAAISFGRTQAAHGATESECAHGLVLFKITTGAGAQPIGAVVPASPFKYFGTLRIQEGGYAITIAGHGDGVTIEEVDHVTALIVAAVAAFGIGDSYFLHTSHTVLLETSGRIQCGRIGYIKLLVFITAERSGLIVVIQCRQWTVGIFYPLADVASHVVQTKTVGVK